MKVDQPFTIVDGVSFLCPFCGCSVEAGVNSATDMPTVLHMLPTCARFDELEPDEFLAAARAEFCKTAPN